MRCSADRSIPMNVAVREILPEKRRIWTFRYSRSNVSRASRKGAPIIAEAPAPSLAKYNITFPPATLLWMGKKEDWVTLKDAWIKEWDQAYRSGK